MPRRYDAPVVAAASPPTFATVGGDAVTIVGSNFGPAWAALSVSFTAGGTAPVFVATGCALLTQHTQIRCAIPAGVGTSLAWIVTSEGVTSALSVAMSSYAPPTISAAPQGAVYPTAGGALVRVNGTNLGPPAAYNVVFLQLVPLEAVGGAMQPPFYVSSPCTMLAAHEALECAVPAGAGAALAWRVSTGYQGVTSALSSQTVGFMAPSVFSLAAPARVRTEGGDFVYFRGVNLGPQSTHAVAELRDLGVPVGQAPRFVSPPCTVSAAHTEVTCVSPVGCGGPHSWTLVVRGQKPTGGFGTNLTSYFAPVIARVDPPAGPDDGGTLITVTGSNLYVTGQVTVGGVACPAFGESDHWHVMCRVAAGDAGVLRPAVTVSVCGVVSNPLGFQYYRVTGLSYLYGPDRGGAALGILGRGFVPEMRGVAGQADVSHGSGTTLVAATTAAEVVSYTEARFNATAWVPGAHNDSRVIHWTFTADGGQHFSTVPAPYVRAKRIWVSCVRRPFDTYKPAIVT